MLIDDINKNIVEPFHSLLHIINSNACRHFSVKNIQNCYANFKLLFANQHLYLEFILRNKNFLFYSLFLQSTRQLLKNLELSLLIIIIFNEIYICILLVISFKLVMFNASMKVISKYSSPRPNNHFISNDKDGYQS